MPAPVEVFCVVSWGRFGVVNSSSTGDARSYEFTLRLKQDYRK